MGPSAIIRSQLLPEYDGVLLRKSVELADILLTAFDSPTGIPFNEVTPDGPNHKETTNCPAAAGTLLLEFGYLSTLTGNCKYLVWMLCSKKCQSGHCLAMRIPPPM